MPQDIDLSQVLAGQHADLAALHIATLGFLTSGNDARTTEDMAVQNAMKRLLKSFGYTVGVLQLKRKQGQEGGTGI